MIAILSSNSIKDKMYTYLNINSIFNLIFCLISLIDFTVGQCSSRYNETCSERYFSAIYQYYYVILIKVIANSVKTCSNIAHLSFSLSRYKKVKELKYIFFKSLNDISFKLYLILLITFSIGINLFIFFLFKIYLPIDNKYGMYFSDDSLQSITSFIDYKINFNNSEFVAIKVFQILKIIFSDLTYIVATTIVDILLFSLIKKQMKNKRKILHLNNNNNASILVRKKKKMSAEYRLSRMIILNGINYFMFRFPYAIFNFYVLIFRYDTKMKTYFPNLITNIVCHKYNMCKSIGEIFYFLFLLSYFIQFAIFYKLDNNFKESFSSIKVKIKTIFISNCNNCILNRFTIRNRTNPECT